MILCRPLEVNISFVTKDCIFIEGEDGEEFIAQSPSLLHDKITAEIHGEIMDKINSIGCTSFVLDSEQIKLLLDRKDGWND